MADQTPKMVLPPPVHIGVAVKNFDEALDYYSKEFGFEPFQRMEIDIPNNLIRGKKVHNVIKFANYQWGPIIFEPEEAIIGDYPTKWWLEERGEGIHHLGFMVDDRDKWVNYFKDRGWEVVTLFEQPIAGAPNLYTRIAFVQSARRGFVFEFIELKQLNKK